jgi:hypothetical protein
MNRIAIATLFMSLLFADSQPNWTTVRDTRENAFSIDVPKDWKTYGGMFRFGGVDARPFIDITSPDGRINLRVGDASIPPYSTPNPFFPRAPRGPRVAPYGSGEEFSTKYGQARFGSLCQSLQVKQSRAMTPKYHQPGQGLVRTTAGETIFSCVENGQPMAGYVYSETLLVGNPRSVANWYVVALGSFLAPVAQGEAAGAMLKRAAESIRFNPEWVQAQQQIVDAATRILHGVAQNNMRAMQEQNVHQEKIMKMQQQRVDNFNDVLLGQTFTRDPTTGVERAVPTGAGGLKWIDVKNNVVDSALSPGPAFHQLQTISR